MFLLNSPAEAYTLDEAGVTPSCLQGTVLDWLRENKVGVGGHSLGLHWELAPARACNMAYKRAYTHRSALMLTTACMHLPAVAPLCAGRLAVWRHVQRHRAAEARGHV